ncbi:hypothetical protein D7D52_28795 [Nocardia yunnanensis]|uniref:Phospholipase n=2 Tax=Nocardia yunnanensis TaxID=2382165 RepID=A0A386ZGW2_9NOCA|nr:hypothetical protein D7D52_28795 [Nocardia yunnanensis]
MIRTVLFTLSLFTAVALGVGAAHATPHDEWCDTRSQYLTNLCNAYYLNDRPGNGTYLQRCYKVVNDWYAECRRNPNSYPDDPCLSSTLPKPDGVDFAPACGTVTF